MYLAPQNIPCAIVLTLGNTVVLYCIVLLCGCLRVCAYNYIAKRHVFTFTRTQHSLPQTVRRFLFQPSPTRPQPTILGRIHVPRGQAYRNADRVHPHRALKDAPEHRPGGEEEQQPGARRSCPGLHGVLGPSAR